MNCLLTLLAALLGAACAHLVHRTTRRRLQQKLQAAETQLINLQRTHVPAGFGSAHSAEHIEFLYDKRLTLFNTRREHEWKIYFGALVLMGAVDAALVTNHITLTGRWRCAWGLACAVVFAVVFGYERQLQIRNDGDREAMYQLYNRLCDLLRVEEGSPVRERFTRRDTRLFWMKYGWAFPWQMILLFAVAAVSALVPLILEMPKR
jgi:hypothetical protein